MILLIPPCLKRVLSPDANGVVQGLPPTVYWIPIFANFDSIAVPYLLGEACAVVPYFFLLLYLSSHREETLSRRLLRINGWFVVLMILFTIALFPRRDSTIYCDEKGPKEKPSYSYVSFTPVFSGASSTYSIGYPSEQQMHRDAKSLQGRVEVLSSNDKRLAVPEWLLFIVVPSLVLAIVIGALSRDDWPDDEFADTQATSG